MSQGDKMDYVRKEMSVMAFLSAFASYLLVFAVFVVAIVVAIFLGIGIYKLTHKNKMQEAEEVIAEAMEGDN